MIPASDHNDSLGLRVGVLNMLEDVGHFLDARCIAAFIEKDDLLFGDP